MNQWCSFLPLVFLAWLSPLQRFMGVKKWISIVVGIILGTLTSMTKDEIFQSNSFRLSRAGPVIVGHRQTFCSGCGSLCQHSLSEWWDSKCGLYFAIKESQKVRKPVHTCNDLSTQKSQSSSMSCRRCVKTTAWLFYAQHTDGCTQWYGTRVSEPNFQVAFGDSTRWGNNPYI